MRSVCGAPPVIGFLAGNEPEELKAVRVYARQHDGEEAVERVAAS
jgi:hypothetical protein